MQKIELLQFDIVLQLKRLSEVSSLPTLLRVGQAEGFQPLILCKIPKPRNMPCQFTLNLPHGLHIFNTTWVQGLYNVFYVAFLQLCALKIVRTHPKMPSFALSISPFEPSSRSVAGLKESCITAPRYFTEYVAQRLSLSPEYRRRTTSGPSASRCTCSPEFTDRLHFQHIHGVRVNLAGRFFLKPSCMIATFGMDRLRRLRMVGGWELILRLTQNVRQSSTQSTTLRNLQMPGLQQQQSVVDWVKCLLRVQIPNFQSIASI